MRASWKGGWRVAAFASLALGIALLLPSAASAALGDLTFVSCLDDTAGDDCTTPTPATLDGVVEIALSPTANSLYVVSTDGLTHFTRAPAGTLAFQGCFDENEPDLACGTDPGNLGAVHQNPGGVAVAGNAVYAVGARIGGHDAITQYARNGDGSLTLGLCIDDLAGGPCFAIPNSLPAIAGRRSTRPAATARACRRPEWTAPSAGLSSPSARTARRFT